MALNEIVEGENNDAISPVAEAEAPGETEETESEPAGDEEVESGETEKASKKGYSQRVRELNRKAKEAEERAKSLAERIKELTANSSGDMEFPYQEPSAPIVAPGEEIDALELGRRLDAREAKIMQRADALVQLRSKQQEAVARIDREIDEVGKLYPELDRDSGSFNKELSEAVAEATEAYIMKNPYSASVKKFVDKMMRPYKGAVSREVGEMTGSVAKQVSEAALRPTSVREKERPAKEKSIEELEAELGILQA